MKEEDIPQWIKGLQSASLGAPGAGMATEEQSRTKTEASPKEDTTNKEKETIAYLNSQKQKPETTSPEGMTNKEKETIAYLNSQEKGQKDPNTDTDPDEEYYENLRRQHERLAAEEMEQYRPETKEEREKRIKREKLHAVIDGIGGAATGLANLVGGVTGGYAFPGWEREGKEDPLEKARKERLERAKKYYDLGHSHLNNMEALNKRLRDLKKAKAAQTRLDAEEKRKDEKLPYELALLEERAKHLGTQDYQNEEKLRQLEGRNKAASNKDNALAEKYHSEANNSSTKRTGGGGRRGKENEPYVIDSSTSPFEIFDQSLKNRQ